MADLAIYLSIKIMFIDDFQRTQQLHFPILRLDRRKFCHHQLSLNRCDCILHYWNCKDSSLKIKKLMHIRNGLMDQSANESICLQIKQKVQYLI